MPMPMQPKWMLDLTNKVYIVYTEEMVETNRYEFQHVWDSSPARDLAEKEVRILRKALYEKRAAEEAERIERIPLKPLEVEFMNIWDQLDAHSIAAKANPALWDEKADWQTKLIRRQEQIAICCRKSIINRTWKPT